MASDEIKTRCLETFGSWIASLSGDIEALMEVVKDDSLDRGAREASTGGINYLFKSLDLIPDGIDDIGYLDDAFTVRVSGSMALTRRISIGSMPIFSASMSSKLSKAKRGCGTPWPRIAPQGGLLVYIRRP